MSRFYQYVKINNRYFCLQQNLVVLTWVLFIKKDSLYPIRVFKPSTEKLSSWLVSWFRHNYKLFKINLSIFVSFVRRKLYLRRSDNVVRLPIYGQLCVSTHKGYKVFDLRRGVVAKVFDHDVNASNILNEVKGLKNISRINFAPSVRRWNIDKKWYEEDYVNGSLDSVIQRDSATLLNKFYQDIAPCLGSLILFQKPMINNAIEYVKDIIKILRVSRLSRQELTIREFNNIQGFIDSVVESLRVEGNCPVHLVFTHGDFCPANMLNTRHGIRIIDWEGAGYRSVLFDFYSYFFYRPVCRKVPVNTLASEINEALPFFISRLAEKAPDISNSLLHSEKVYRWLYYIELICNLVEREMTDSQLDIMDFILRYIDAFNRCEKILVGKEIVKVSKD